MEGTVEYFKPIDIEEITGRPIWFRVKFQEDEQEYALHINWVNVYGELKEGDKVTYEPSNIGFKEGKNTIKYLKKLRRKDES